MSYPILYETNATDFFNLGLGTLPDAISPLVTEERNGEFVFDMSYPINGRRADLIKNNRIIKVDAGHLLKDQRFVIKTVTPQMDNSGKTFLMIHAEHVSYLANDLAIKPIVNGLDVNASQALSIWNSNLTTPNQFIVDSDINSKNSFSWSIDKVQNGRQALGGVEGSILDHWHGEYRFDNLHISLLQHRGTIANTLLAYGRNLTTFEQEESILETYTSVYPYALLTPAGSDSESKIYTIDGLIIDSTHAANFPNRKVLPVDFSNQFENVKVGTKPSGDDADKTSTYLSLIQVQSKLKEFAQVYISTNNVGVPKVSIKVSFVDLANTVNYADVAPLEELDLCDEVPIRFSKLGIDTTAKVSRVVWNVLTDSYDSLELGEISATLGDKLTEIEQTANKAQDTADKASIVQVGADGKSTIFRGSDTPIANHVGDLWYKPNGEYMEMYQWDGVTWHFVMSTKDTHDISDKVDQAMQEMADKVAEIDAANNNSAQALEAANLAKQTSQEAANSVNLALNDAATAKQNASDALASATQANNSIIGIKSDIDTINGKFDLVASKQDINTLDQRVKTNELAIKGNSDALELTAKQSDVDLLGGRIGTAENSIKVNAKAIEGKASNSTVDELTGELTTAKNHWKVSADGIKADLLETNTKIDGIQVGSQNMLPDTDDYSSWNLKYAIVDNSNPGIVYHQKYDTGQNYLDLLSRTYPEFEPNTNYIFSFYAKGHGELSTFIHPAVSNSASGDTYALHELNDSWQRYLVKFTTRGDVSGLKTVLFRQAPNSSLECYITKVQLESGTLPTDYGQMQNDFNKAINAVRADLSITAEELHSSYTKIVDMNNYVNSKIGQEADRINLKVQQLPIAGHNLVSNSGDPQDTSNWQSYIKSGSGGTFRTLTHNFFYNGSRNMFILTTKSVEENYFWSSSIKVKSNTDYTLTFDVFADGNVRDCDVWFNGTDGTDAVNKLLISKTSAWSNSKDQRVSVTFNTGNMTSGVVRFDNNGSKTEGTICGLYVGDITLVEGRNPAPWMPADDIVSQINLDKSGVYIGGNKIWINGQTMIDNAVIKSAMIDTIDASKITAGILDAANVNIINLNVSKLVGDTTNFVQSAWNSVTSSVMIDPNGLYVMGEDTALVLNAVGLEIFAYNSSRNLEYVGSFAGAHLVGNDDLNGTMQLIEPEGDFIGWGHRQTQTNNQPFDVALSYWKSAGGGYQKGINSAEDIWINSAKTLYVKKMSAIDYKNRTYLELATSSINGNYYPSIFSQGLGAGLLFGASATYLSSGGYVYNMTGTIKGFSALQGHTICIPTSIVSGSGAVNEYVRITLS